MDLFASDVWGKLGVTFDATTLQTDGYKIVAAEERGSIDNEANVGYQNVSAKLDYNPTDRVNLFFRAGVFDEERNNGKIGELNDTKWKYGSGGVASEIRRRQQRRGAPLLRRSGFFPEHVRGARGGTAAQPEQSVTREDRADHGDWHDGARGRVRSSSATARTS